MNADRMGAAGATAVEQTDFASRVQKVADDASAHSRRPLWCSLSLKSKETPNATREDNAPAAPKPAQSTEANEVTVMCDLRGPKNTNLL